MKACGGAYHWARELTRQGHTMRIIAADFERHDWPLIGTHDFCEQSD